MDAQAAADALENLSSEQREVVVLRTWGQMTLQEISALLGTSVTTVYRQYHQGLAALRQRLENPCPNKIP
jgi:RNA polymerase sigma factor (sigma-70 family)